MSADPQRQAKRPRGDDSSDDGAPPAKRPRGDDSSDSSDAKRLRSDNIHDDSSDDGAPPAKHPHREDIHDDSSDDGAPPAKHPHRDDSSDGTVLLVKRTRKDNHNNGASSAKPDTSILRHIAHRMLMACLDSRLAGADLAMRITLVYSTVKNMSDAALEHLQLVDNELAQKIYPYAAFSAQLTDEARTNLRNICMHMIWRWIGDVFKITRIAPFIARMCANNGWLNHDQTSVHMAQKMYGRAIDPALGLTNLRMVGQNIRLVARADGTLNDLTGGRFVGCTLKLAGALNMTDVVLVDCHIVTTADVDLSVAKMFNCRVTIM